MDEEFDNFMHKVNQVSSIVQKLASGDKNLQEIGDLEAKKLLGEDKNPLEDQSGTIDEGQIKIKNDRTVINKKALLKNDNADNNPENQSPAAFMAEIEKDANMRYQDRLIRQERMETFKKRANLAFKRGEYEKALTLYNKAIEQIKDSCFLYLNRALTHINLKLYAKAMEDLEWAFKLDENSLKGWLLLAKIHYLSGNLEEYRKAIGAAKSRNKHHARFVDEYVQTLESSLNPVA